MTHDPRWFVRKACRARFLGGQISRPAGKIQKLSCSQYQLQKLVGVVPFVCKKIHKPFCKTCKFPSEARPENFVGTACAGQLMCGARCTIGSLHRQSRARALDANWTVLTCETYAALISLLLHVPSALDRIQCKEVLL